MIGKFSSKINVCMSHHTKHNMLCQIWWKGGFTYGNHYI